MTSLSSILEPELSVEKQPLLPAAESKDEGITFGQVSVYNSTMTTGTKANKMTDAKPIIQNL